MPDRKAFKLRLLRIGGSAPRTGQRINCLSSLDTRLTPQALAAISILTMLQELHERWAAIQKRYSQNQSGETPQERISEELNLLETLRLAGGKSIPGETSDIEALINERHKQLEEILRKRRR